MRTSRLLVRGGSAERLRTDRPRDPIPAPVPSLRATRRRLEASYGLLPAYEGRIARELGRCLWLASLECSLAASADAATRAAILRRVHLHLNHFTWWMAQDQARTHALAWERTH